MNRYYLFPFFFIIEAYFDGVPITHAGRFVHGDLGEYDRKIKG